MTSDDEYDGSSRMGPPFSSLSQAARLCATAVGVVLIFTGLTYVIKVTKAFINTLQSPESIEGLVSQWHQTIEGDNLTFILEGREIAVGHFAAVAVLGLGGCVLAMICLALIKTGASIISNASGDKEAIKKILRHVFPSSEKKSG